ncbi:NAD(+) synthase [Fervidobacterium gondwanense]|uniref:NH(3)-dependent NAD(+) synthetase n=1 Tax=Fervidobacterium gondwanense DSM 13020 TaxID=1121883 RepID=A0A1M7SVJ0_FERGO|nr:NAD(+) synthase [Fervidobacterium gondwanense]SHN62406.1 NH(3)-dependent NAD(+) synthetase [Fervidobacterium gondwanense DSM 13020]
MNFNPEVESKKIERFINELIEKHGYRGAVIGVSGGIDSAVVLALLVNAVGKAKIKAFILPERDSSRQSIEDAKLVCQHFGVEYRVESITKALSGLGTYKLFPPALFIPEKLKIVYAKNRWNRYDDPYAMDLQNSGDELFLKGIAYYRSKHRIRMCKLYFEAEKLNYCVVGTTNKTELKLGLYVKWGDDSVDIEPIKHLYKTQVFELARYLNVPEKIIKKPPTPDLVPGLTDEEAFGMTYQEIDSILMGLEKEHDLLEKNINDEKYKRIMRLIELAKYREIKSLGIEDAKDER